MNQVTENAKELREVAGYRFFKKNFNKTFF